MNRKEFKRLMKAREYTSSRGLRHTRKTDKREDSERIAIQTEHFLKRGGAVDFLESYQASPVRAPAFNGGGDDQ